MRWTKERAQIVRDLAAKRLSANQIAKLLDDGTSRNAIIGLCSRLGIQLSRVVVKKRLPPVVKKVVAPPPPVVVRRVISPPPPLPPQTNVSLIDLKDHQCRWPLGTSPYTFCGKEKAHPSSYCTQHSRQSIQ